MPFRLNKNGELEVDAPGDALVPRAGQTISLGSTTSVFSSANFLNSTSENVVRKSSAGTNRGRIFTGGAASLVSLLGDGATDTTITVESDDLSNGDILYFQSSETSNDEWMQVDSAASANGDNFDYTVIRDLASTGRQEWPAGTSVADTGQTGDLCIDLHAEAAIAGEDGPALTVYRRASSTYDDLDVIFAVGDIGGSHGFASDTLGAVIGREQSSGTIPWITFDETGGVQIEVSGGTIVQVDTSGIVSIKGTSGNLLEIDTQNDQIGEFGVSPVVQPASADQATLSAINQSTITDNSGGSASTTIPSLANTDSLTDSTGGTVSNTLADMDDGAGNVSLTELQDNVASLASELATQRTLNAALIDAVASLTAELNSSRTDEDTSRTLLSSIRQALVDTGRIKGSA